MTDDVEYKVEVSEIDLPMIGKHGLVHEMWLSAASGHIARRHGPAIITYDSIDGTVYEAEYFKDGKLHRLGGPAETRVKKSKVIENWYTFGLLDRRDGPAKIERSLNGTVLSESWYSNGRRHRDGGPAYIRYDKYQPDQILEMSYFYAGKCLKTLVSAEEKYRTVNKKPRTRKATLG